MLHASALAGACAGLVSSIVTCPLDVVKTRLQAQSGIAKQLKPGWNGPAAHPSGGIGGSVSREVMASRNHKVSREGLSSALADNRHEGLRGESEEEEEGKVHLPARSNRLLSHSRHDTEDLGREWS
jgi:solute carrier family 25 folate transporter 32